MRYQRLDLNLLTALRALLTEKNVTRAGESLFVSQSAMSGILARLREYFDDPLIVPVGRRMELTPLGESLVSKVNDLDPDDRRHAGHQAGVRSRHHPAALQHRGL